MYKVPPQLLNGEVPQVRELVLVEEVIEHCEVAFNEKNNKKNSAENDSNLSKITFIKLLKT